MIPTLKSPWCAYAQEGITDPDHPDKCMVAYITKDEPGYQATTYTGDLAYCKGVAALINQSLGHTPEKVTEIVASSMRASFAKVIE